MTENRICPMESFLNKINRKTWQIIAIVLIVLGFCLIALQFIGEYTLVVNGKPQTLRTFAFTPRQVLHTAGLSLQPEDRIFPEADKLNLTQRTIILDQAMPVQVAQGETIATLLTAERIPANLLAELGVALFPEDRILWNGSEISWDEPLPAGEPILLQFQPAHRINLKVDGQEIVLFTQQRTLGAALWEAGISLRTEDRLSLPLETVLSSTTELSLKKADPVIVAYAGKQISGLSAAETVGEALAEIGIPLKNLDYAVPAENEPLPADGTIRIVQVREEIRLEKEETAYQNTYVEDPNAELDTVSVVVPGQVGLVVTRTRVRLEDGKEVASFTEGPWKASDPQDGVLGRGTKVVVRTET
ncbi:MAG TPA: ubiquitin-like domain-containing protein, partial [Anaerolineaceae bacterium]|nr:ubiquitin-like domain-containing protein [Anaerolineaceae bacterium]